MQISRVGGLLLCAMFAAGQPGFAQTSSDRSGRAFVDGAVMAERDPTDYFYGSDAGSAVRAAVGVMLAAHNSLRLEVDVPRWRVMDTTSSSPVWCAEGARCVGGVGWVPARTTSRTAVRTVSYSFLGRTTSPGDGARAAGAIGGASAEQRPDQSSSVFDELGPDGRVVRHTSYDDDRTKHWPAAVLGLDADVTLSSHLAVTPQFRFHTFPYPAVSITRPGIALRWRF